MQAGDGKGGPMSMQTKERAVPNGVILEMTGDLTYANREHFKTAVEAVRQRGCRHLILSMADVRFVDSSGLGLLALVAQEFKLAQGIVSMLKPQSYVREIMSLANIPKLIPLYDNEQDAVAGYRQAA
jgi:anti-anti-sigma factor